MKKSAHWLLTICALTWAAAVTPQQQAEVAPPAIGAHAEARSPGWKKVRDAAVKANPECAACGRKENLEAHHCEPFHKRPELELDPANLIVLCRDCHGLLGHLRSWKSWNTTVREDAAMLRKRIKERP